MHKSLIGIFCVYVVIGIALSLLLSSTASAKTTSHLSPSITYCTNAKTCDGRYAATTYDSTGKECAATQKEVHRASITDGIVILYYSTGCKTNWSWVVDNDGVTYIMNANVTRQTDGAKYQSTIRANNILSPMVYAPVAKADACGSINNWTGGCTGYY